MDKFIIYVPFNIKFPHLRNNINREWVRYRLNFFNNYTLKSLSNQTDRDFSVAMMCCKESKDIVLSEIEIFKQKNQQFDMVDFYFSIEELYQKTTENDFKYIYFLKVDSDDLYHKNAVSKCRDNIIKEDKPRLIWFKYGFDYNVRNNKMWYMDFAPSFYGTVFRKDFYNIDLLIQYCFCDQTTIRKKYRPLIPFERMYCCLEHYKNIHEDPRRNGNEIKKRCSQFREVPDSLVSTFLKDFGV